MNDHYLEVLPWEDGGTGPRVIGPWIARTLDLAKRKRDKVVASLTARGHQVTAQEVNGWPGALWWSPLRPWGSSYLFGPGDEAWQENARPILEEREGELLRPFEGLANSSYRHLKPDKPAAPLRIVPVHQWCDRVPKRPLTVSNWPRGSSAVGHWYGPGTVPQDNYELVVNTINNAVDYHMDVLGWNFGAYSYATCNIDGIIFEMRGRNKRTAATGNTVGNGLMSCLMMASVNMPDPGQICWNNFLRLVAYLELGRRTPHSQWNATACPGPNIHVRLRATI